MLQTLFASLEMERLKQEGKLPPDTRIPEEWIMLAEDGWPGPSISTLDIVDGEENCDEEAEGHCGSETRTGAESRAI
jgi:hypothetical protein